MNRNDLPYSSTTCADGINEDESLTEANECASALNVFAPRGKVEQRPGYVGLFSLVHCRTGQSLLNGVILVEDNTTTTPTYAADTSGTVTLSSMVAKTSGRPSASLQLGDRWYLGTTSTSEIVRGLVIFPSSTNSASSAYKLEYWNGASWQYLPNVTWIAGATQFDQTSLHLSTTATLSFVPPNDWALKSITSTTPSVVAYSRYWLRFEILDANLDSSVVLNNIPTGLYHGGDYAEPRLYGLFAAQFPSTKRYIAISVAPGITNPGGQSLYVENNTTLRHTTGAQAGIAWRKLESTCTPLVPCTMAVVPQFNDAFVTYNGEVFVLHDSTIASTHVSSGSADFSTDFSALSAQVETRGFATGNAAPYDPDTIAQLAEFPRAKYITFFKGRLWALGIEGEEFVSRWSAPAPYHKVWPALNVEPIMENDNSKPTGQYGFGEHMIVGKSDSLWRMVYSGLDPVTGEPRFIPIAIEGAKGVGWVSQSSIVEIAGRLYFLAEDGVYIFNGVAIEKLTDRIASFIQRITPGRRPFATATHWKKHNLYMLAVSLDGSDVNTHVLVFDYRRDNWWVWDNIEAQSWLRDEDAYDNETLYFGDSIGRIYQMGVGRSDHGAAITSRVRTHRFGWPGNVKRRAVPVFIDSSNLTRALSVSVIVNDDDNNAATATLDLTDHREVDYGEATSTSKFVRDRKVKKRLDFRASGDHYQVEIEHSTKDQPFELSRIYVGEVPLGR